MDRKDILSSPNYWATRIQIELYNCAEQYMRQNGLNRSELAKKLGVSRSYVTQLLNGDFDHRLSKMTELVTAFGYIPVVEFVKADAFFRSESVLYCPTAYSAGTSYTEKTERVSRTEPIETKDIYAGDCKLKLCA